MYLLGPLSLLSLAMWLYPPAKILDISNGYSSASQRVGAEGVPDGDWRIARRYRENQSASFRVGEYRRYQQTPDDSRVLIEIALLWLLAVGGGIAWRQSHQVPLRGSAPPTVASDDSDKIAQSNTFNVDGSVDALAQVEALIENLRQLRPEQYHRIAKSFAVHQIRSLYPVAHKAGNQKLLRSVQNLDNYLTGDWVRDADIVEKFTVDTTDRGEGEDGGDPVTKESLTVRQANEGPSRPADWMSKVDPKGLERARQVVHNLKESKLPSRGPSPPAPPAYEELTPKQKIAALEGFKKDLASKSLQLEPDAETP